ncbi:DNA cytosine methyltransferase [Dickeya dianthicola]|uniref:DNA (cytosine-5-)-methyltransferase n=1 Tax=Dickeya dianthicola TaxID=204039 RepID=A0ABX9NHJ6_9GAMM|nr:DNA cytosine methyltransferase [Dickeya dianthicola]MCI4116864.1 DNA cytosine methyltransferase [Dickeya dianthicola]MCI4118415.1 DNA cytosine methyltransferase [Dickeya dianthicola]MCI4123189.1 DNA cytosine methyltransferase [Dickeya dianthicola]MCI4235289.1 DNA cytosine methyltransferase [Dickeya dianthicola]RJL66162.1 DNA cytosine methyltransferase [Dickeya dianthicola]
MDTHHTSHTLQYGSVCSGIEAVSLAWEPLGLQAAWFSEVDPFPNAVLAYRYPHIPNLGDITRIADRVQNGEVTAPDILVGGTPCQAFSIAGTRRGLNDPRGALTLSYVELANVIDQTRIKNHQLPATLVWENVSGVLSDRSNAFGCLLGALAGESHALEPPGGKWAHAGHVSGPRRCLAWRVLDAQYFGVAQRRKRVFLVASGRDDIDPCEILFERNSVCGGSSAGSAPWQKATRIAGAGTAATGSDAGLNPYGQIAMTFGFGGGTGPVDVAACLMAAGAKHDICTENFLLQNDIPMIAVTAQNSGADAVKGVPPTLRTRIWSAIAFAQNGRGELRLETRYDQIAGTRLSNSDNPSQNLPTVFSIVLRGSDKSHALTPNREAHFHYTPIKPDGQHWPQWKVRRLMPVECERLQGMPDGWTQVPYRGKPAADTPRYKAIGNSMAVPCVAWLGQRLLQALQPSR